MQQAVKIDVSLIPEEETRLLSSTFCEAVMKFYENPKNLKAFEAWKAKREEC